MKMSPDGFHLAFSGGKDSQVLYHIAKMAGVKFKAYMQVTTIDPPELMGFERAFKRSIQKLIDERDYGGKFNATADELFDWYLSNMSMAEFFGKYRGQTKLEL